MTDQTELFEFRQAGNLTMIDPRPVDGTATQGVQSTVSSSNEKPPPAPSLNGQTKAILEYMQSGKSITPLEALNLFGCFRLGARIWDLKRAGHEIETEMIEVNKKHVAKYSIK